MGQRADSGETTPPDESRVCQRGFDIGGQMPGQVLGEFTQLRLKCLVIVFAQLTQGLGRRDDKEIVDFSLKHLMVEPFGSGGSEAVLLEPSVVRVSRTASVALARTFVVPADGRARAVGSVSNGLHRRCCGIGEALRRRRRRLSRHWVAAFQSSWQWLEFRRLNSVNHEWLPPAVTPQSRSSEQTRRILGEAGRIDFRRRSAGKAWNLSRPCSVRTRRNLLSR